MPTPVEESFAFSLFRRRLADAEGRPVTGDDPSDLEQCAQAEALSDAGAPPELLPLGHGRLTVISHGGDVRDFVREKLAHEVELNTQYLEAKIDMDADAEWRPAMGHLMAVSLPGGVAVVYEVVFSWVDCEASGRHMSEHSSPDWVTSFTLPSGHAILRRGPELPLVSTGADDDEPEILGGSDAKR